MDIIAIISALAGICAAGIAWAQLRRTPKKSNFKKAIVKSGKGTEGHVVGSANTILLPPIGRLPKKVLGRNLIISHLRSALNDRENRVHVLAGAGGTGKTTVALSLAKEWMNRERFVWWVPAVDSSSITFNMMILARELGASAIEVDEALAGRRDPAGLVWRYLNENPGWLIIFDNADNVRSFDIGNSVARDGTGWIRPTKSGSICITTRNAEQQVWGDFSVIHLIGWLDKHSGAQLLLNIAPEAGTFHEAQSLAVRLGGFALALHNAGHHLISDFSKEHTFISYLDALETHFVSFMEEGGDARSKVMMTWEISIDSLEESGFPQAREMLRILSFFASSIPIPLAVVSEIEIYEFRYENIKRDLSALRSVGLIESRRHLDESNTLSVAVHPFVAETQRLSLASTKSESSENYFSIAINALARTAQALDHSNSKNWPLWDDLIPHLMFFLEEAESLNLSENSLKELIDTAGSACTALLWAGSLAAQIEVAKKGKVLSDSLGISHPSRLRVRRNFATALMHLGKTQESQKELEDLLESQNNFLGAEHESTLETRHDYANALRILGHLERAEAELKTVYDVRRRILGENDPLTLYARHDLAYVLRMKGYPGVAEKEHRIILDKLNMLFYTEHPSVLAVRHDLAHSLLDQGLTDQAIEHFNIVAEKWLEVGGENHTSYLLAQTMIGVVLYKKGRYEEAERKLTKILEKRLSILGANDIRTLELRYRIAVCVKAQGRFRQARQEFEKILDHQLRLFGERHPDTKATMKELKELKSDHAP